MTDAPHNTLGVRSVLAVCAHPDDESFGLGGVLSTLAASGVETRILCFTHGEASSLGADLSDLSDLAIVRTAELAAAAATLGVTSTRLCSYPDGHLIDADFEDLVHEVGAAAAGAAVDCLLVFDDGGITGHPDHQRATDAALAAGRRMRVPVLAWTLPTSVAQTLHDEFGAPFVGRDPGEIDIRIEVDRRNHLAAIACHASQSPHNAVLQRRLALQGAVESLRWLSRPHPPSDG
ncbi:MAG: PIG-L deacetylase family protein [Actinomycetota bacterium]|nr:PIG-L deacetylase family protein [Actinomycetota bacterium]